MTRVVLSIGSNMGDRIARLQSVVDGLGKTVLAVSPVYETDPWGGVEQSAVPQRGVGRGRPDAATARLGYAGPRNSSGTRAGSAVSAGDRAPSTST